MKYYLALLIVTLLSIRHSHAQTDTTLKMRTDATKVKDRADTSRFAPNVHAGWSMFHAYLATVGKDTFLLEAAVSHARNVSWEQYQLVGRIRDKAMRPTQAQEVTYSLLTDRYLVRVDPDGGVYVRLSNGQLPAGDPIILPLNVTFKGK